MKAPYWFVVKYISAAKEIIYKHYTTQDLYKDDKSFLREHKELKIIKYGRLTEREIEVG